MKLYQQRCIQKALKWSMMEHFAKAKKKSCWLFSRKLRRDIPQNLKSSVITQKSESQSGCYKKTKHAKSSKKENIFYPLIRTRIVWIFQTTVSPQKFWIWRWSDVPGKTLFLYEFGVRKPFVDNVPILYPLKTLARNGLVDNDLSVI